MDQRERIEAALSHIEPDRTPMFEYVLLSPVADAVLGRQYVDYTGGREAWDPYVSENSWDDAIRRFAADRLDLAMALGHDMMYIVPNPLPPDEYRDDADDDGEDDDDPVERLIKRNDAEAKSLQDPENIVREEMFEVYFYLKEEMRKRGIDLPIIAPVYFHGVWTDTDLMQTTVLEPEVAVRHFQLATERALLFIERYAAEGIDQFGVGGDFAGNRMIISPQVYREMIVPEIRILSDRIHQLGGRAVNTTDGNIWPVLDDFLYSCGADGYLEIDMHAGMDLAKLKKEHGSRITLYGNMDCGNVLSFSSPEEVAIETVKCIEAGLGSGGHVFCASNAITASIPIENYMSMVNAYRSYFGLAHVKPGI